MIIPATYKIVGELLSSRYAEEMQFNRKVLFKIMENIRFLARQGIALRGDGEENDSNFFQLFLLSAHDDPNLITWTEKKMNKFTSPQIQNELIKMMAVKGLEIFPQDLV